MRVLNRTAVVVTPKQPFLEWLHAVDASSGDLTLVDLCHDPSVYLLPDSQSDEHATKLLARICDEIFVEQLNSWYQMPESWPQNRSFRVFKKWFDYRFHTMVMDTSSRPLIAEEM